MANHNVIVAITGKSSSGKDAIARILSAKGYKYVVSTTTRPRRSNETNHEDYHFVSELDFKKLMDDNKLVEYRYYDTITDSRPTRWHYGIERAEIDLDNNNYVCVVDLAGLEHIEEEYGSRVISFYIDVDDEKRQMRALARDRNFELDEWERRLKDDEVKFKDVDNFVDKVVNNDSLDKCLAKVIYNIDGIRDLRQFFSQYCSY